MLTGLLWTAFLMGLGGIAHCAAMCGVPCAAAMPRGIPVLALVGRCLAYGMLGLLAALGAGLVSRWGQQVSMLQPIWLMIQLGAVIMGVWLMWSGHMPRQVNTWGQQAYHRVRARFIQHDAPGWLKAGQPLVPLFAGMAWAVLPCGLLYAALVVAALAPAPWAGALVMLAFAVPSAIGVWAAPALLKWLSRFTRSGAPVAAQASTVIPILWLDPRAPAATPKGPNVPSETHQGALIDPRWAVRLAGLSLALIAGWAVSHQLVTQWQAWCA